MTIGSYLGSMFMQQAFLVANVSEPSVAAEVAAERRV